MYDPETAFRREEESSEIERILENIQEKYGYDSNITKRAEALSKAFNSLQKLENDLDNCFDEEEEEKLISEGETILALTEEILNIIKD